MVFRVLFLVMFPCFRSEVIQNLLDQSDGPRMAQDGPGSSQWWWTLLWGTREQRRRLLQSLMDNVTLVGVLLSAIRITDPYGSIRSPVVVVALKKTWIHEFQGESRTWRCCCWCSLVFYTQFGLFRAFRRECLVFWAPWVSFIGNESDNVYVSAVMVKIMSVAQREEKAWLGFCSVLPLNSWKADFFSQSHETCWA